MTLAIDWFSGAAQERANTMLNDPSLYNIANWATAGLVDTVKGAVAPEKPLSAEHWIDSAATASLIVGAASKVVNSGAKVSAAKSTKTSISPSDAKRIQNAANRTKQQITVIGSRANGTATLTSDWDYILSGNSAQRHSAASSLPRGVMGGENNTGIDIFSSYVNGPNPVTLDRSKPYITFFPE